MTIGVGFVGGGPVVQAIHLPTLARMPDLFHVAALMDVDPEVARTVAGRVGAAPTSDVDALLGDPAVEVVAICSPHAFHADQAIAAIRAGKRAVLVEKPFATTVEQAESVAAAVRETGTPVIVGAMHLFDPGWLAVEAAWGDLPATVTSVRSSIVLPPNPRFEDFATEVVTRPASGGGLPTDPDGIAAMMSGLILGLSIHDLPLVRRLVEPEAPITVLDARLLEPGGYAIDLTVGDRLVEIHALLSRGWRPDWRLTAIGADTVLETRFTPSYVQAGSATSVLTTVDGARAFGPADHNGYEGEWRALHGMLEGRQAPPDPASLVADLAFALAIADAADTFVREAVRS